MYRDIKLDDRTFEEIKKDAISRIATHCPEWTNHNPSDPGVTLVELFSYMTEMTQYRLNQVPTKNYLAFLDLLGIEQRLPIPATSRVQFNLSSGYQMDEAKKSTVLIPQNTKVATVSDAENQEVIFETKKAIHISNLNLSNIYSKSYDALRDKNKIFDYSDTIDSNEPFYPFNDMGKSKNIVELFLGSEEFYVLQNDIKMTVIFRLPTTVREFNIKDDFLENMDWSYYDGQNWQRLKIAYDLKVKVDESDADILSVTFEGNCENLQKGFLDEFDAKENYFIKATFKEVPVWLEKFSVYEVSIVTNANAEGILADECYHNYELIDINNSFFPFGTRPMLEENIVEEMFYIKCDQAFCEEGTSVELNVDLTTTANGTLPTAQDGLKIEYEYSISEGKWGALSIADNTDNFTESGTITFSIPENIGGSVVNATEGYWIRAKIVSGNYGKEVTTLLDEKTGQIKNIPSTLNPPVVSSISIKYSHKRKDLEDCYSLNNYLYEHIKFDKNRPVELFKNKYEKEDALFLGFDAYLSEESLELYFDVEQTNIEVTNQRVIEWEVLIDGEWQRIKAEDATDGLTQSGDILLYLPKIEKLEYYSIHMQSFERLWIKAKIKYNSLKQSSQINKIVLNSVDVIQKNTHFEETLGYSNGLPSMEFSLENKNLVTSPVIKVDEDEFKAVERFIDYGFEDKIFKFNGVTGKIEFGDGKYGKVPPLSSKIVVEKYSTTNGTKGNVSVGKISVLKESINYVDSVKNIYIAKNGHNGDSVEDVKRLAPSMINSMKRAVTISDYENLALGFSTFIKKAKCIEKDGEVIVLVMSENIIRDKGFINSVFLQKVQNHLQELSMVGVTPRVEKVNTIGIKLKLKLKYADESNVPQRSALEQELLENAKKYLDPFSGLGGKGYEIGRTLLKSDIVRVVNNSSTWLILSELKFIKDGIEIEDNKLKLAYNEVFDMQDIMIEELSYDF